ncbi:YqcC family protein [Affinibrenneria salicis]|uniref:YqcC family protein n=1 Tax=Affinibrenneria salicis TaxID=2590031 RepID=A0A5J5FT35_9GAMM|nr:YqcC family protein [Affinibrenneria salicis]KAA8996208.1 YqcC family protein [Affinibrenneria salicis]
MSTEQQIRASLLAIEQAMRDIALWQTQPPAGEAFASSEPFCIDTLRPEQWLQWVLLPRMHALLDSGAALPARFVITPYFEEALEGDAAGLARLLAHLRQLDTFFAGDSDA